MRSIFNGAGYLIADNRASDWGTIEEADLIGCAHCNQTMKKRDWQEDGGFCHCCAKPICGPCADAMPRSGCVPYLRKLERAVDDAYRREQNRRILGI
jgi:hypothetical protein